jgi:hypothetical protein
MPMPRISEGARAVVAARTFLALPHPRRAAVRDLIRSLVSLDLDSRRMAADIARRISGREPSILAKYVDLLIDLAAVEPSLRAECSAMLEHARIEGTVAMRARARRMLTMVAAAEKSTKR